jgi:catechol 2,3-dioxygenase-like lactoylglutathione lyase family enzyme
MTDGARIRLAATVLDAPDAQELARFYQRLLGREVAEDEADWVVLRSPGGGEPGGGAADRRAAGGGAAGSRAAPSFQAALSFRAALSFQTERGYVPPVWPAGPGDPQMSMHLDFEVDDLDVATAQAVAAGAILAGFQPQDDVRVFLDPAGHPFCFFLPY